MLQEQTQGFELDPRTDQYTLGCIMYEMLTGIVPFDDGNFLTVMFGHASAPVPALRTWLPSIQLSDSLEQVVMKTLAKEQAARYRRCGTWKRRCRPRSTSCRRAVERRRCRSRWSRRAGRCGR